MPHDYVLAIDAGTTGVRSRAVFADERPGRTSYREFTQHFPEPGRVEHDAEEIWTALVATMRDVIDELGAPAAIGITNQRETVVAWNRIDGQPFGRAIVWQDRRTADECTRLAEAGHLPLVRRTTGLVLDPYFSGTKMRWLLDNVVGDRADVVFGTIDTWIVWKLTTGRVFATDPSNASRTMLFDIEAMSWSDEMCELLGVRRETLPEVRASSERWGVTDCDEIPRGIPISGVAGDQQSALFGQACLRPGMAKNTYGTGSFVLMNVGDSCPTPVDGLLTTVAWTLRGTDGSTSTTYALEGAIFVTGAAVQWLRDGLGIITSSADIGPLAETVDDAGGVVIVPAFTGLGSPWWDPYARGTVLGITRGTTRAHLARAVVDSMALQTRDAVEAMVAASGVALAELRVDGGASVMNLLLRLQADQLGISVRRPTDQETTSLGAAFLAGLAEGIWPDLGSIEARWSTDVVVEPHPSESIERALADAQYDTWKRAVERSLRWAHDGD